uniref:DAGKc domain-containing protein n=1 Tax=Panagrellus redivivus TaxID=6233 RepID=A0A7E4V653_PANRE
MPLFTGIIRSLDKSRFSSATATNSVTWTSEDPYLLIRDFDDSAKTKPSKPPQRIYLDDILNIRKVNPTAAPGQSGPAFDLVMYPIVNGKRVRRTARIMGGGVDEFEKELRVATRATEAPHLPQNSGNRRILLMLNPFSGQRKAMNLYESHVKPIFEDIGCDYELLCTKHANHATEIAKSLDLDAYSMIAILSGDGLVNEVLTGLICHPNQARALKMPILHIPGGTGNALAASVAFKSGESFSPRGGFVPEMALMATNPAYYKLSLGHFEGADDGHKVMFLSAVWGLMADIDIGSERFRWAGMIRLHMEAFIRIVQLPSVAKYKGRISYKPVTDDKLLAKTRLKWNAARKAFGKGHFEGGVVAPLPDLEVHLPGKPVDSVKTAFSGHEDTSTPSLSSPVPSDWITLDSEYVYIVVSSLSHLGSDVPYLPSCKMEDEVLFLSLVDWRVVQSRYQIARMFIDMDICSHLDYTCLHIIPVHACRIEPAAGTGGYVAVDGEPCTTGTTFQVATSKLGATVVGRKLRDEN